MIFTDCDDFNNSFSQWTTSATDSVDFAGFWSNLSDATTPRPWYYTDSFMFDLPWERIETIDLPATEKNVVDYPKGKLRMPKPQCPRGFKHLTLRNEFSGPHFR